MLTKNKPQSNSLVPRLLNINLEFCTTTYIKTNVQQNLHCTHVRTKSYQLRKNSFGKDFWPIIIVLHSRKQNAVMPKTKKPSFMIISVKNKILKTLSFRNKAYRYEFFTFSSICYKLWCTNLSNAVLSRLGLRERGRMLLIVIDFDLTVC